MSEIPVLDADAVLATAVRAVLHVLADVRGILTAQLVVQVLLELGPSLLTASVGHLALLGAQGQEWRPDDGVRQHA